MSLNVRRRGLLRPCERSEPYFTLALLGHKLSVAYVEPGEVDNHFMYDGGLATSTDEMRDALERHES